MKYLQIEDIKQQLIIDADFSDDDELLTALGETAEELVEKQIDDDLSDVIANNNGRLPAPLKHAMKMIVEYLYNDRGSGETEMPKAFFYMCHLYRNYK